MLKGDIRNYGKNEWEVDVLYQGPRGQFRFVDRPPDLNVCPTTVPSMEAANAILPLVLHLCKSYARRHPDFANSGRIPEFPTPDPDMSTEEKLDKFSSTPWIDSQPHYDMYEFMKKKIEEFGPGNEGLVTTYLFECMGAIEDFLNYIYPPEEQIKHEKGI